MSEYSIRTMLNDIDIDLPPKLSIKYPIKGVPMVGYFIDNSALIGTE